MALMNTQIRKFLFFDEIKELADKNISDKIHQKNIKDSNDEKDKPKEKLNISLSSVVPTLGLQCLDEVLFLCGTIFYKETKTKNNRMLKIVDNKVIDEYIMFNKYYDFQIMKLQEKPILVVFGSMRRIDENLKEITSIKFYNASNFIENKDSPYETKEKINDVTENYKELLLREIKFYKKGNNIVCEAESKIEDLPILENCTSLVVDDFLNYAAIGINKRSILILSAYPNLIDCKGKKIKIITLTPPDKDGVPVEITNIKFGRIITDKSEEKILYVSTKNYLAYYEWICDDKGGDDLDNNVQCKFIENITGVGENCLFSKDNLLLVANNDDKFIYEYTNLTLNKINKEDKKDKGKRQGELAIEGPKKNLLYFINEINYYIIYQIEGKTFSTIQIYDNINNFLVFIKTYNRKILSTCQDGKYIYLFVEESESKKYIVKLIEKENKKKFDILFQRKLYDIAIDYANYLLYDDKKLTDIYKKQGEYEYSRGEFDKSIEAYIKTINYLDPSIVIQMFLTKSKMEFLIKYLEAIESNISFKQRSFENYTNYTTLLLNCYLMKEEIPKLKEFLDKKDNISPEILKTAIDVCLDTSNIDLALDIALSKEMYEDYLQILILKQNKYKEALDFIYCESPEKEIKCKNLEINQQINLFCKFGENFLKSISDIFFNRVTLYMEKYKHQLNKEEKKKLFEIFVSNDTFYKKVFDMMGTYEIELDKNMLHRRLELYLEDKEYDKIIEILKKKEYLGKYDNEYLMMLFKHKNFLDGIETLSELTNQRFELLSILIQKREYNKIINLCKEYGISEKSFWGLALNFFVDKEVRKNMDEQEIENINKYLEQFLDTILENKALLSVNVLDIINEKNDTIPLKILRKFINTSLDNEVKPLNEKVTSFEECNGELKTVNNKIKEIQTQASSFKLTKCETCFMGITFPAVCFRCGHCYHSMCLNSTDENDYEDIDCPKCYEEKVVLKEQILDSKSIYDDINSKEKLEEILDRQDDKFEFIHKLYGRGVINIGPANEDFYNNKDEINKALDVVGEDLI